MAYKILNLIPPAQLPVHIKHFEASKMQKEMLLPFFQSLILAGMVHRLKGPYQDIATILTRNSLCFSCTAINDNAPIEQSNNIAL